jgi:hypothetical protein
LGDAEPDGAGGDGARRPRDACHRQSAVRADPRYDYVDTTIRIAPRGGKRSQLDFVLGDLSDAIGAGNLEVFLCKSYQKCATFGFGRVAAGDLTLLSMRDNLAYAPARYEARLVVHILNILQHANRHELILITAAAANARFVDRFCWPVDGNQASGRSYVDDNPPLWPRTILVE